MEIKRCVCINTAAVLESGESKLLNLSSSLPNERPHTAAFLDPMSHPVQAILVPTEHRQGLE